HSPSKSIRQSTQQAERKSKGERLKKSHQRDASSSDTGKYAPIENPSGAAKTDRLCAWAHDANAPREMILGYRRAYAEIEFAPRSQVGWDQADQCSRLKSHPCNVPQS